MKSGIKVFLVDDNELTRYNLRCRLEKEENIEVIGDYADAEEAISQIEMTLPDIVLLNAQVSGTNGIEVAHHLRRSGLGCNAGIIMLVESDCDLINSLGDDEVDYFLVKDTNLPELTQVIRQVDWNIHSQKAHSSFFEESFEIVISPSSNSTGLKRLLYRLEEISRNNDNFARIMKTVGSRKRGVVITIITRWGTTYNLLERIGNMPEVEALEELATISVFSRLGRRFGFHPKSRGGSNVRARIIMKEKSMATQVPVNVLN